MEAKKDRAPKPIKDLFAVYKKRLKPPQSSVEKEARKIIEEVTTFALTEDQVSFTPGTRTLYLAVPSVLKQEILFKKDDILNECRRCFGKDATPKVIL